MVKLTQVITGWFPTVVTAFEPPLCAAWGGEDIGPSEGIKDKA